MTDDLPHPFDLLTDIDRRNTQRSVSVAEAVQPAEAGRLAVRLGPWNLMFSMDNVVEIIPIPRVTQVPGVKSWLIGIANLRGTIISVIDLQEFLSNQPTNSSPNSRLVVVRANQWQYGLLVDEIVGMRQFGTQSRLPTLDDLDARLRNYVVAGFESERQRWFVFNMERLLNDPQFLQAGM